MLELRYASTPKIEAAAKFTIAMVRCSRLFRNAITWLPIHNALTPPLSAAPLAPNLPPVPANTRLPSSLRQEDRASATFAATRAATLAIHSARPARPAPTFGAIRGSAVAANSPLTAGLLDTSASWAATTPCQTRATAAHLTTATAQLGNRYRMRIAPKIFIGGMRLIL